MIRPTFPVQTERRSKKYKKLGKREGYDPPLPRTRTTSPNQVKEIRNQKPNKEVRNHKAQKNNKKLKHYKYTQHMKNGLFIPSLVLMFLIVVLGIVPGATAKDSPVVLRLLKQIK